MIGLTLRWSAVGACHARPEANTRPDRPLLGIGTVDSHVFVAVLNVVVASVALTPVATAQEYRVYGRTSNSEAMFWTTPDPFFTDTGAAGAAGKPGSGTKWMVKNSFELKNAQDVLVEGNVFEHVWVADQPGYPILFTPRNQNGTAPWVVVQRVMFRNNLVRHTSGGVNILGTDNLAPSQRTRDITIVDNVFDDLTASIWGSSRVFLIGDGADNVTIDHNTIISTSPAGCAAHTSTGGWLVLPRRSRISRSRTTCRRTTRSGSSAIASRRD